MHKFAWKFTWANMLLPTTAHLTFNLNSQHFQFLLPSAFTTIFWLLLYHFKKCTKRRILDGGRREKQYYAVLRFSFLHYNRSDKGVNSELHEIFEKRIFRASLILHLAATWSLYTLQALALATKPMFSDLNPPDGGWSQNPMLTVFVGRICLLRAVRCGWCS